MLDGEKLLTLPEAAAHLAVARGIKRSYGAVRRWCETGVRGVRLEALEVAGRWHTSAEALERFFEATTRRPVQPAAPRQRPLTAAQRRDNDEGLRRLREMGVKV